MRQLKRNLRFTDAMRQALALAIAQKQSGDPESLEADLESLAQGVYEKVWEVTGLDKIATDDGSIENGDLLFPMATTFTIMVDELPFHIPLGG